jgi:membrane protein YdbS with pleckstrin-like domain
MFQNPEIALSDLPGTDDVQWQVLDPAYKRLRRSVLLLTWPGISLPKRGYVLRDKDILFRKGVVWRSVTAIPFNRIQHVETSSTPFDRKFDLATLQLFTAGGSSGDLKIDGLSTDIAEQLRVFVLEKAGASIEIS